jgi:transposase
MKLLVGIDWASQEHAVCVIDEQAHIKWRDTVAHTADGLAYLCRTLANLCPPVDLQIAIERPSGLLVDTLVDAGFVVVPIHPNMLKASRSRYSAAHSKTDPGDAYILADLLRTDGHRLRPLRPLSDETKALRALARSRDDLVEQRVALANQLRALLESFWPGAAAIFAEVDSPITLAFLQSYPTPQHAARLGVQRLAAFLGRHGYSGRRPAAELLARLRAAPIGLAGKAETNAKALAIGALVSTLKSLVAVIAELTAALERAVQAHTDGAVIMSFPRAGRVNAAQILAELGDDRRRFLDAEQLAAEAGVAPVTRQSGKHRHVGFRWACNKRLRQAVVCWADNSRHQSAWAAATYHRARARGCDHPHAVRILARAWLRVLWRCWQSSTPYSNALHRAATHRLADVKEAA